MATETVVKFLTARGGVVDLAIAIIIDAFSDGPLAIHASAVFNATSISGSGKISFPA